MFASVLIRFFPKNDISSGFLIVRTESSECLHFGSRTHLKQFAYLKLFLLVWYLNLKAFYLYNAIMLQCFFRSR